MQVRYRSYEEEPWWKQGIHYQHGQFRRHHGCCYPSIGLYVVYAIGSKFEAQTNAFKRRNADTASKVSPCRSPLESLPPFTHFLVFRPFFLSQGAVLAMTRELAMVHAREGIRLNSLCPFVFFSVPPLSPLHESDTPTSIPRSLQRPPPNRFVLPPLSPSPCFAL